MNALACPDCDGYGYFSDGHDGFGPLNRAECASCDGTGQLVPPPDFAEVVAGLAILAYATGTPLLLLWLWVR